MATETFGIVPGDAVYGFGETFLGLDKAGQSIALWVSDAMGAHTPRCHKPVPFFLTTGGYGVFLHTSNRVSAWVGSRAAHQIQVATDDSVLDHLVLLGSPADILAGYTALTGRAPLPPAWSLGWWQSRRSYASAEELLGVVGEMRAAGIPMDVIHLDTNWFAVDWRCDLEFAPDRFPDPAGLCRALADQGVHIVAGYQGPVHVVDWTSPAAVRVMEEEYGRLFATGASVSRWTSARSSRTTPSTRTRPRVSAWQPVPAALPGGRPRRHRGRPRPARTHRLEPFRLGRGPALPGPLGRGRARGLGDDGPPAARGPVPRPVRVQLLVGRHRRHR